MPHLVVEKAPSSAALDLIDAEPTTPTFDIAVCTLPGNFANRAVAALWHTLRHVDDGG